ncbi:TPA: restriction endonuclease subunit S [Streptococcus suis]
MSEVVRYKLSEFATITSSKRVHLSDYVEVGVPFYRSKEIIELANNQGISETLFISEEKYNEIKNKYPVPQIDDILITAVGTIGKIYLVKDVGFYFKDGNLIWIRDVNKEIININYLYYFLNSPVFQSNIIKNNIGAVQKAITIDHLKSIELDLPTLEAQNNISNILKNIDQKIALNNQINEELEAMAKTLYDYWFVQFDFPDENGNPYKSSGGKMVYNDQLKREIPEGWGVRQLGEICEFRNGINYEKSETGDTLSKIVNVRNISNSSTFVTTYDLDSITLDRKRIESYLVTDKTILITRSGIPGATRIVSDIQPNTIYSGFIIGATVTNMNLFYYVFYHLKNIELLMSNQSAGTIMKNISQTTLSEISIAIPNDEIQKKFSNQVCSLLDMIENNLKQNQELTQLRDWLLPMLMNGQVTVE